MVVMNYVKYICRACGAEDTGKFFPHEQPFPFIICWSCKAGSGMKPQEQAMSGTGMWPEVQPAVQG